jgi:hypothetical protein
MCRFIRCFSFGVVVADIIAVNLLLQRRILFDALLLPLLSRIQRFPVLD